MDDLLRSILAQRVQANAGYERLASQMNLIGGGDLMASLLGGIVPPTMVDTISIGGNSLGNLSNLASSATNVDEDFLKQFEALLKEFSGEAADTKSDKPADDKTADKTTDKPVVETAADAAKDTPEKKEETTDIVLDGSSGLGAILQSLFAGSSLLSGAGTPPTGLGGLQNTPTGGGYMQQVMAYGGMSFTNPAASTLDSFLGLGGTPPTNPLMQMFTLLLSSRAKKKTAADKPKQPDVVTTPE